MTHLGATADLLKVARSSLREAVMPRLDTETRYEAAMIANAMAIAIRELELGARSRTMERELLAGLYGTPDATLVDLRTRLCRDLRDGAFGAERAEELRTLLQQLVHARLAISNPEYGKAAQTP